MKPINSRIKYLVEIIFVLGCLLLSTNFLLKRIHYTSLPSGDEGSWMSVAAEFSKGNGFTTRWMEYHILEPYELPRPDDFRYPALVSLLAVSFKIFGISHYTALITVLWIFQFFLLGVYFTVKKCFGTPTAAITLFVTSISLLQIYWNTVVYPEGLFGLVLALLIFWTYKVSPRSVVWWVGTGAGVALLFYVRPNGILLCVGIFWTWFLMRKQIPVKFLLLGFAVLLVLLLPWFIRNALFFHNPIHIAGSAGLLRGDHQEPATWTVFEFLNNYGILFPLKRVALGFVRIWQPLHYYEQGLEIIPCILVVGGIVARKKFYNPFVLSGFCLTFFMCCYAGYNSWAGVRYFSAFLPFVYAYGIHTFLFWTEKVFRKNSMLSLISSGILVIIISSFVFYPHRFFERQFSKVSEINPVEISTYVEMIQHYVEPGDTYFALSLCQLNFMTERMCLSMNDPQDYSWVKKATEKFNPSLLVLSPTELSSEKVHRIIGEFEKINFHFETVYSTEIAIFLKQKFTRQ